MAQVNTGFLAHHRLSVAQMVSVRLVERTRERVAREYLRGEGLEIGALHHPLRVPTEVTVRYVDRLDVDGLRDQYPELVDRPLVPVDVIDDGEVLRSQEDESHDFVIANHFLEHTEDPIGTVENHLRVLREGGHLYVAVPMKEATFDALRPLTPLEHVIRDRRDGPESSRSGHYEEWARLVDRVPKEDVAAKAADLEAKGYSIHFHVWDEPEFMDFMKYLQTRLPLRVVLSKRNRHELIVIAQKTCSRAHPALSPGDVAAR